jgi:ribokinase
MISAPPKVVVVGSLNLDYIATVRRLPVPGETVPARKLVRRFGGKGANQAVAAARHGARVSLIGCVGEDDAGRSYRRRLRGERIDTGGLSTTARALTGTALIAVDDSAENLIVVAPGANGCLTAAAVRNQRRRIEAADVLLLQFEVPMAALIEACRLANQAGISVALNPSPLREGFPWGRRRVDTLIVNEGEAAAIFGLPLKRLAAHKVAWRAALARKGVERLFVTQGAGPTICLTRSQYVEVPALRVRAVDTVGAGDAFAGALVTRLAERADLAKAVRCANCAGALATLRSGAQEAIPIRAAVERHLRRSNS